VQHFEYQLPDARRELRDFEARVTAMRTGDFLVLVRDVTDRKGFEAELVAAREHAVTSDKHKTQFLANVSHEIRTPLNSILGVTQLLRSWSLPAEADEYLDLLQTGTDSLLGIVDDVLDLSKIEANRLELSAQSFDAEKTIAAVVKAFAPQARKKGIALELVVQPAATGTVRGDPLRLRQIVNNLVSNAVKFTDAGTVRVLVSRDEATGLFCLKVCDSGPGIEPEMHERIFEPFVQTEGTQRRYGGTGLGLSISQHLSRLMGGDIRVQSTVGAGTAFTALLDLPTVMPEVELTSRSWRPTPPPRALVVLLAEDNEVNATMTSALVGKLGHVVVVVGDGQAAVEAVREREFDLVLMDVQMPLLDGLQATRVIRESERGGARHLPIVALTANAMKGDDLLCLSAGMDAYLPKPVTVEALKDMLMWFGSA
jgi:two-component system CheB/CheR fusion protein